MTRSRTLAAADAGDLADVRAFVRESAGELGAGRRAIDDLVQAVDEAACNVVLHGYRGRPGPLEVSISRRGRAIEVVLRDRAPAFDPTRVSAATEPPAAGEAPAPTEPRPSTQRRAPRRPPVPTGWGRSGQGLQLLRSMVDEAHHRARPDGGNELTLIRDIHRPGEED